MKKGTKQAKRAKARNKKSGSKRARLALPTGTSDLERKEAEHFVETLKANKQLSCDEETLPPGATHKLETDKSGATHLVRKRYSSI